MDDVQIIGLYNARDEKAITETESKYGKYCLSIARNILWNMQDCEECVSDTWLQAWNTIPPKQPSCLRLFLAKITRNLSINRRKQNTRLKRGGDDQWLLALEEVGEFVPAADTVETAMEEQIFVETVADFLRTLSERERGIFLRRYFHMESTAQIAAFYRTAEGNVQKSLSRTRQKLRTYLEKEGYTV
jgi:RNA polymerase sigma-70 factor (ECF subfamily)